MDTAHDTKWQEAGEGRIERILRIGGKNHRCQVVPYRYNGLSLYIGSVAVENEGSWVLLLQVLKDKPIKAKNACAETIRDLKLWVRQVEKKEVMQ